MRILFISQLFDPENSIKGLDFARRLQKLGHEIEIITTFPSYPGGKVYPGYRQRFRQAEWVDGVRVVRIPTYISHGASTTKRLLSYLSFGVMGGLYALSSNRKADVLYAYYPPVVVGLLAMVLGAIRKIPYIYDVQDLWPEALVATGNIRHGGKIEHCINKVCNLIYRRAARIVVLSEGYRTTLIKKGVQSDKIVRVFNWCDESRLKISERGAPPTIDKAYFNILYAGNLGAAQALEHVVEAARILQARGGGNVRFVFLGTGVSEERLKNQVENYGLQNVQFLPRVSADEVSDYLSAADALLVHLADDPVFEITIPQKTQAYMMAARPIIMAVRGEASEIVRSSGAGITVEPCRPEELAKVALEMSQMTPEALREMADKGLSFYRQHMSMEIGINAINAMINKVAGGCANA